MSFFLITYGYKLASLILITNNMYVEEYRFSVPETLVKNYIKRIKDIIKLYEAIITITAFN